MPLEQNKVGMLVLLNIQVTWELVLICQSSSSLFCQIEMQEIIPALCAFVLLKKRDVYF